MTIYEKANVSDFLEIAALDREVWKLNNNPVFIPDGEHVWRHWVECALVYTAKEAGNVKGVILAFPCIDGSYCIHKVFIEVDQRSSGIGSKLFEVLLAEIDSLQVVCFLTADPENESAITLYEKWGFTEREFVSGYYRSNEDRYVLTRQANNK